MAAVPVLLRGVLYDLNGRTVQNVLINAELSLADFSVGGGPIIPPGQPPHIWGGGNQPFPTPPIPIFPGGTPNPPGTWGGAGEPFPGWGLPPVEPPANPETPKPPPPDGGWGWHPEYGWGYFPGSGGKPKPPA